MAVRVLVALEQRGRRRGRGWRSGCCSCCGWVPLLLIVTADAHDAVFVSHILLLAADRAHELQLIALIRHDQAAKSASTAACEKACLGAAVHASFIFLFQQLTVVGIVEAATAVRQQFASLLTAHQRQRVSAHCMSHAMRTPSVHVAAWC
jgi:hypothetical protein